MKILVCMKQVPQKDAPLKLNEAGTWIREDVSYEVNEPDAFALEEALRQKEKHGGEVVAITAGPARSQQVLREALAKGADRAIDLEDAAFVLTTDERVRQEVLEKRLPHAFISRCCGRELEIKWLSCKGSYHESLMRDFFDCVEVSRQVESPRPFQICAR